MHSLSWRYNLAWFGLAALILPGCRRTQAKTEDPNWPGVPPVTAPVASPIAPRWLANHPLVGTWAVNRPGESPPPIEMFRLTFKADGTGTDTVGAFVWKIADSGKDGRVIVDHLDLKHGVNDKYDFDFSVNGGRESVDLHLPESTSIGDMTLYRQR